MPINLSMPQPEPELKPRITVVGVGGAGCNAVNNMIRSNLEGVEFLVSNSDAQALAHSRAERRIQLGAGTTRGLGAGSRPDVGRVAAEEALAEIMEHLEGSHMVFITAGMGGGTGTGAAPVIAQAARERGILTVGVVTKPFHFEGQHRMRIAESGIEEMQQFVDTLIVIPNQNLFRIANEKTTFADAFKMADDVLHSGVRGVTDLMVMPGLINLDFADIRTVMSEMGKAMMGTGEGSGDRRALDAAEAAISNPLLDDVSMKGARGVLINITGGPDITLFEVDEAANRIRDEVDPDANIIFGSTFDESLEGRVRISVVATGIDAASAAHRVPAPGLTLVASRPAGIPGAGPSGGGGPGGAPVKRAGGGMTYATAGATAMAIPAPEPGPATVSAAPAVQAAAQPAQAYRVELETVQPAPAAPPAPVQAPAQTQAPVRPETARDRSYELPSRQPADTHTAAAADYTAQGYPAQGHGDQGHRDQGRGAQGHGALGHGALGHGALGHTAPGYAAAGYPAPTGQRGGYVPPRPHEPREPVLSSGRTVAEPTLDRKAPRQPAEPSAAPPRERAKRPSLFNWVTGTGASRAQPAEPRAAAPRGAPLQQRIEPAEHAERPAVTSQEEDLLDIPAFLRRQAN